MIVTPEGLNVFPEDVERVVNEVAGVRESAVVGVTEGAQERVHAVVVAEPGLDPDRVIREANARLQDHQRIRAISVWPGSELPRTEGTRKLKRAAIRDWVKAGGQTLAVPQGDSLEALIGRYARGRQVSGATTLEELGLTSLERVELMVALEDRFQTRIDETRFAEAASIADLQQLVDAPPTTDTTEEPVDFPTWNRSRPVRLIRRLSHATWIVPLTRLFAHARVEGLSNLRGTGRAGHVRVESPEPHGCPGDPLGHAGPLARPRRAGHAEGVLRSAFPPGAAHVARGVHELAELLPGVFLLQHLPDPAA